MDIQQAGTQLIAVYNTMFLMFSQFGKLWPAALEMETTAGLIWVTLVDMPFVVWLVQFIADKLRMPQDLRVVDGVVFVLVLIANALVFGRRGTMQIIKREFRLRTPLAKFWLMCGVTTAIGASLIVFVLTARAPAPGVAHPPRSERLCLTQSAPKPGSLPAAGVGSAS